MYCYLARKYIIYRKKSLLYLIELNSYLHYLKKGEYCRMYTMARVNYLCTN